MYNNIDNYHEELIRRCNYLSENSFYILAPYMHKENDKELKDRLELWEKDNFKHSFYKPMIYFEGLDKENLLLIEKLLLEEIPLKKTIYYKRLEKLKDNNKYLEKVKSGGDLLRELNNNSLLKYKLDINKILLEIENNILRQSGDLENKQLKLQVLNVCFSLKKDDVRVRSKLYQYFPMRNRNDIGVTNNKFINYFANKSDKLKVKKLSYNI